MSYQPERRYPFAPLEALLGNPSADELERRCGFASRSIERWKVKGIPETSADRMCALVGLHPANVWPDLYAEQVTE